MYMYMYRYTSIHRRTSCMNVYASVLTYVHTHVYTCACTYTCTCTHAFTDVHHYTQVYMHMYKHGQAYIMHESICTCTCTEMEQPCLSGKRRICPCITSKDLACPAELPRWLSWQSICLVHRSSRVRIPPEAAPSFLLRRRGVVFRRSCLASMDLSCMCTGA